MLAHWDIIKIHFQQCFFNQQKAKLCKRSLQLDDQDLVLEVDKQFSGIFSFKSFILLVCAFGNTWENKAYKAPTFSRGTKVIGFKIIFLNWHTCISFIGELFKLIGSMFMDTCIEQRILQV